MNKISVFDIAFIAVSAGILSVITYTGYAEILSTFSLIVVTIAYFSGKYLGKIEQNRKQKEDKSG
jgi:hypothetical protein